MTVHNARKFARTSKVQILCEQIYDLALRLEAGAKLPTVIQLSHEFNVSKASVDLALHELETQKIVERRHGVGIFVSGGLHQKSISVICSATFFQEPNYSPFWDLLLEETRLRTVALNEQFELHLAQPHGTMSAPLQRGIAREIASGQVHGVIGVGLGKEAALWIEEQGVPFVSIFGPGHYTVELDNPEMLQLGVQQLKRQGCQRIAFWQAVAPGDTPTTLESDWAGTRAFNRIVAENGLQTAASANQPALLTEAEICSFAALSQQEQGFEAARRVFTSPKSEWPDGILIEIDKMAHGALMALQQLRVKVGTNVQIVTHANKGSSVLLGHNAAFTLLEYDPAELVQAAFLLLEDWGQSGEAHSVIRRIRPHVIAVQKPSRLA